MPKKQDYKYGKRIQSLFGINLPPRKKKTHQGWLHLRFILTGTLPSKKNQWISGNNFKSLEAKAKLLPPEQQLQYISENLVAFIRPNNNYLAFEKRTIQTFVDQAGYWQKKYAKYGLSFPLSKCSIADYFYWENNMERDNTNKAETIHDILVDSGILINDMWQVLTPTTQDGENYHGEILENIIEITITVKFDKPLIEVAELHKNSLKQEVIPVTPKVKQVKRQKKSKYGIENPDLINMGWYGYTYSEEDDGEKAIDLTPPPSEWTQDNVEQLRKLGYRIDILRDFYNKKDLPKIEDKT